MKLILAIVNNDDSAVVSATLTKEKFSVTKLSTTGGFLMIGNTTLLIGAEGGFDESEVELALSMGIPSLTLGPRILRCETAPMAALSVLMYHTGNMN